MAMSKGPAGRSDREDEQKRASSPLPSPPYDGGKEENQELDAARIIGGGGNNAEDRWIGSCKARKH
jgi:hypothetical protein